MASIEGMQRRAEMTSIEWMRENFIGRVVIAEDVTRHGVLGPLRAVDQFGAVVEDGYTLVTHFFPWHILFDLRKGKESDITRDSFHYKIGVDYSKPLGTEETKRVLET